MVYCGKPSKGCSNCRERKIRCDQREPGCGQCEKRQQTCPGYRNLVDLMIRDESSHVIKKANAKRRRSVAHSDKPTPMSLKWSPNESSSVSSNTGPSRKSSSSSSSTSGTSSPPSAFTTIFQLSPVSKPKGNRTQGVQIVKQEPEASSPAEIPAPLLCHFAPSFEDRGLNLFIARYITVPENNSHHKFDFVFDVWTPSTSTPERANDPVFASITAVGLLGVAQMTQSSKPLDVARKSYGHALRLTNAALRNPTEALKDSTMLSVLVLGMFERMMDPSRRGLHAWQQHIAGAAALARMRGMAQFRTKAGVKMFMMQCQNTMINCIQHELPMPQDLIDLRNKLISLLGGPSSVPGYEVCIPIYKILQLKYDIKQGNVTDIDEMLEKFNEAENDFERAVSFFPAEWQYRKLRLTQRPRPGFFNNVCHIYPSISVATTWNGLRTCRMLILETMIEELHKRFLHVPVGKVPERCQVECQKAKFKMHRIALAILASVPQHFELVSPSDKDDLDTLAPMSSTEDPWPQIPESNWEASLGESESSDSSNTNDTDYHCRSPSLSNPMQAQGPEAQAERFMLLASVANGLVWPLYVVGMSASSSASMKSYVSERLHAIHAETGLAQARKLADVVASHNQSVTSPSQQSKPCGSVNFSRWNNQCDQRPIAPPV